MTGTGARTRTLASVSDRHGGSKPPHVFDVWNELWVGALSIHDRHLRLEVTRRLDAGNGRVEWRIIPRERR